MYKVVKKYLLLTLILIVSIVSCTRNFDDLQVNPNKPGEVPPSLLFTYLQRYAFQGSNFGQMSAQYYVNYFNGGILDEATYYWQRVNYNLYTTVRNAQMMVEEAERIGAPDYFKGIAHLFRAYTFVTLTERVGDIPYSEAMKGRDGIYYPKYDTQKEVYLGVLDELEKANELIPSTGNIEGDITFDGSLLKWKKLVNTYRLKVLNSLSLKTGDPDLNVINQFKMIYENPDKYPIMTSNSDNAAFYYYDIEGQRHYLYSGWGGKTNYRMSTVFGKVLTENKDPRLFKFFEVPQSPEGLDTNDFNSYKGMSHGLQTTEMASLEKITSPLHNRYEGKPVVEPYLVQSFSDLQFVLAEAAYRGWIQGDVAEFYNNAIRSSCQFYGIPNNEISTFLNGNVKYDPEKGLNQIYVQRWVGTFGHHHWDAVSNHRRTRIPGFDPQGKNTDAGWPEFEIGSANRNGGKIPFRYLYPQDELDNNREKLAEAVSRQWGSDDINNIMWILKPDFK